MKKYIIMALLPLIFQGDMQCVDYNADLNKAIQQQLISARKAIGNVKLPLELDRILLALVSYAKRGDNQSVEAINKMEKIGDALEQYKVDQYTSWTWYFGPTPAIVKDYIQPAIGRVVDNLKSIQTNAMSLGYKIALVASGAALTAILAGAGLAGWFMFKPKSDPLDANVGDVYKAKLDARAVEIANEVMRRVGFQDDSKRTYYGYAYDYIHEVLSGETNIDTYSLGSEACNEIIKETVGFLKQAYYEDFKMKDVYPIEVPDGEDFKSSENPLWAHGKK